MKRPSLVVLDVGHGSAAVLLGSGGVVVVDTGKGGILLDFLRDIGVRVVDTLLISHADADHIRNAPDLLLDREIVVKKLCYNTDASKKSQLWKDFQLAIRYARRTKQLSAEPQLTTSQTGRLDCGEVSVEVLYPPPEEATSGPGGAGTAGDALTANSMSAVVRIGIPGGPKVLLAGDVEGDCLRLWAEEKIAPSADVLVFPHHGGNPGPHDPATFARELTLAVNPGVIIFSIHRALYNLPRPEIIDAIRRCRPEVHIMCTQLSAHCSASLPSGEPTHLSDLPAQGKSERSCCAGSIVIDLSKRSSALLPMADDHHQFVRTVIGEPFCTRKIR
jgi:beta-lactamase superfamily II metal-dependent hydrolase